MGASPLTLELAVDDWHHKPIGSAQDDA